MKSTFDPSGKWFNQHGSEMEIEAGRDGCLSGWFRSGVGCAEPEERFPLVGFVSGGLVTFSVDFGKYDSLTSWTGHAGIEDGRQTILALWHMSVVVPGPEHPDRLWEGVWSGADTFLREAPAESGRRSRATSHPVASSRRAAAPVVTG